MSKRKHKRENAALFATIAQQLQPALPHGRSACASHPDAAVPDQVLAASSALAPLLDGNPLQRRELPRMKKFRFQLLHQWLLERLPPCRVADVGGGKGLLAYLLQASGWPATVVDPLHQPLPSKYKDLRTGLQVRLPDSARVPRIDQPFAPIMAGQFDLLVALHAHGCNLQLIDAAAEWHRSVILLPCCIIHEPLLPPPGTHWITCVVDYALQRGFAVEAFRLNFKGQNIGLYLKK